jgi:hypothetical protein
MKKNYLKRFQTGYPLGEGKEGDHKQDGKKAYSERQKNVVCGMGGRTSLELIGCRKTLSYVTERLLHTVVCTALSITQV